MQTVKNATAETTKTGEPKCTGFSVKSALKTQPNSSTNNASATEAKYCNNMSSSGTSNTAAKKKGVKKKKALTWDEHAIEEHDLLRGSRMQIDEPNTPYHYYDHQSDEDSAKTPPPRDGVDPNNLAVNWDKLENKLDAVAAVRDMYPSSPSASSFEGAASSGLSDSDGGTSSKGGNASLRKRAQRKEAEFVMHRKNHYNEMEKLRNWRAEHNDDDDE